MGLLAALGGLDPNDDGTQNGLQRFGNALDPQGALANQGAIGQQLQNQQQQQALAYLADQRAKGVTDPRQILSGLASYSPDIAEKLVEIQAKNPLAFAFTPTPSSTAASTAPQEDAYILKPEGADDKRNYDFLNTKVPAQYRATVRAISNGDESVGNADSLRSNGLLNLATNFDPSLSKTDFAARQATAKDFASGGKSGQGITSANTAVKHLAQVALAGLDLHNGSNQISNYIGNKASALSGNDPTTNLESTVDTVAPELAKAAASGGDTTEADRNAQKASFGIAQSPEQLLGAVAGKADLINSKMEEVGKTYSKNMGGRSKETLNAKNKQTLEDLKTLHQYAKSDKLEYPEAQGIIKKLRGVVGQEIQGVSTIIPEGATATGPNGAKIVRQGGKWVPAK